MASKPLISVIGSLNIDFVTLTPRVPQAGEILTAKSLKVNAGGKGANQAVACGKASFISQDTQDVEVEMVGAVGEDDPYVKTLLKPTLEASGVATRCVREVSGSQTGTATILVEENGQNRILVVPGANYDAMKDSTSLQQLATEHKKPAVLIVQGEIPRETVFGLLEGFASMQTQIIFNPAPVYTEGIPPEILQYVNYLVVNESECLLLGKGISATATRITNEDDLSTEDLEAIANDFHNKAGIKHLVVTLGAKGVFYHIEGQPSNIVSGRKVPKVVDTTAAGDTFVGYFAAALARHVAQGGPQDNFDVKEAINRANSAAAMCVQKPGAMQSIPFGYEVEKQ